MTSQPARPTRAATLRGMAWMAAAGFLFCLLNAIARRLSQELDPFHQHSVYTIDFIHSRIGFTLSPSRSPTAG